MRIKLSRCWLDKFVAGLLLVAGTLPQAAAAAGPNIRWRNIGPGGGVFNGNDTGFTPKRER